ncbi:MAG: hypothetical protein HY420_04490 [Candidatus Kerfeldbacteria bacterium]|nr:hypothetical protein [Candidatus Kerfeldbacteria bacterium]
MKDDVAIENAELTEDNLKRVNFIECHVDGVFLLIVEQVGKITVIRLPAEAARFAERWDEARLAVELLSTITHHRFRRARNSHFWLPVTYVYFREDVDPTVRRWFLCDKFPRGKKRQSDDILVWAEG